MYRGFHYKQLLEVFEKRFRETSLQIFNFLRVLRVLSKHKLLVNYFFVLHEHLHPELESLCCLDDKS
jgi:hypothetical protein